ncbi:UvrD-helicase domain-containing protein [Streptomyces zhihengii]|uniref:UvrD-helicase domain-containing protein n=1 Tax=Streptomyces zhihengii TaxID=1818004 RepID=UPI00363D64C5
METFIREWAANNQPIIEAIRRGDEDAFRTLITEESTQLDAAQTTGSAPDPLPETGTPVPDAWAPWPDELAALADASGRDTDLRLRLGAGRGENPNDLIATWTEHHALDTGPATMLAQYFDENSAPSDMLHAYLRSRLTARLAAAQPMQPTAAELQIAAATPVAELTAWRLSDPQGMGESEDPYPDQVAAREGALAVITALGEWTRTWSGAQYQVEKAIKEIADGAAATLLADALTGRIGTHAEAAHLTRQVADLASELLLDLEEDSRNHPSVFRLADSAYDHAARMHATTVALADRTWPPGTETGEQLRARELALSIDRQMPASQLLRRTGADAWDAAATYTSPEIYALASRPGTAVPEWERGGLTLALGDDHRLALEPVGESESMTLPRPIPLGPTLQELAKAVDGALSGPLATDAETSAAAAALEALRAGTLSHLRGHFPNRQQFQAVEERLSDIGGGYDGWQEQAVSAERLADAARQVRQELEDALGRPSARHAAVPAHHALTLLASSADSFSSTVLPHLPHARSGRQYSETAFLRDQQQITALAYLLQHLPHPDTAPVEQTRRLVHALRMRDGHHGVGEFAGELHRHRLVADAAEALAEASSGSRADWARNLHDAARHHTDRIARHLAWSIDDGQQAPSRVPQRTATAAQAPTAAAYPQAESAQSELLQVVRQAVAGDDGPHRIGLAPVVLAALLDAQDRGIVYSDHIALHAFAEELREAVEARRHRGGRSESFAAAAHAARSHAAILAEAARDSEPALRLAVLKLQRRAEADPQLMAHAESGAEPAESQRAFRAWLAGSVWQDGMGDDQLALLQAVIARTGPGLGDGILAATWDKIRAARPSAITAALAAEFPQGTVRKSITAFRNRRTPLMAQVAHVLALPAVRERLSSPHLDELGAVVVRQAADFLADDALKQRSRAYRGSLTLARATRHLAEQAYRADLPATDQEAIADLHASAQSMAADWVASGADSDARARLFLRGEDVPLCPPSPSTAPGGSVTDAERVISRALDRVMEPAAWGGGGYQLESRVDGTTAILLTRTPMDADGWRARRTGQLESLGWSVQSTQDGYPASSRGESLHLVVDLPRGRQAEQWQLASEVRSILEAHRRRLDPTQTFDVRPATERHFAGGSTTTAVIVRGTEDHLQQAGYTTERLEGARLVVTRPEGAVPIGTFTPAAAARPASVRLHTVAAAMRPLHAQLTDLLTLVHDRHPARFDITELQGMWDELAAVDATHPLDTNPPGVLGFSARREAVNATRIHHVLTWLQNGYVGQSSDANQQVAALYGPGADRFIRVRAATLLELLHDYGSGQTESARIELARTRSDPDGRSVWDRYAELIQTPDGAAPEGTDLATARAAVPTVVRTPAPTRGTGQNAGPAGKGAAQDAAPGAPDAGGSGGNDQTRPPAPGGNDEPEQPRPEPAAVPGSDADEDAVWPAFTRRRQISAPRRALGNAVRELTRTAFFRQRSDDGGVEAELRDAFAAYTAASMDEPHGFHDAIERLTAALAAVSGAWPRGELSQDAARALTAATSAGEELRGRWRATATSPSWEALFEDAPRPTFIQREIRPAPSPGEDYLSRETREVPTPEVAELEEHELAPPTEAGTVRRTLDDDVHHARPDAQGRPGAYEREPLASGGWEVFQQQVSGRSTLCTLTRAGDGFRAHNGDVEGRGATWKEAVSAYADAARDARENRRTAAVPTASPEADTAGPAPAGEASAAPAAATPAVPASPLGVPVADTEAQGRWEASNPRPSTRLTVSRERTHVLVTGVGPGEEDATLREWLKSKHFSFVPATSDGRWDSNKDDWRRPHPKAAVFASNLEKQANAFIATLDEQWRQIRNRIGQALTSELRAEYEQKARDRENFPLTEQQRAIIDAAQDGLNVAVQALAGTGKTSTMVALARRMPNRRITYLAFNSANAADARLKFAGLRHVSVSTAHSLAARDLMVTDLADKVADGQQDGGTGTNANAEWADILGVQPVPSADRGEDLTAEDIVVLIKETIRNFRNSDSAAIDLIHVPDPEHPLMDQAARPQALRRAVLEHARDAWQDKINPASRALHFHHDDYLKIWALSRPRIHADTVIFDEAQDINPVLRKVVLDNMRPTSGPPAQVVIVGDPNQSIYAFRGAENALEDWPADIELPLNKSWRFGPEVADIANIFLKLLRAPYLMEGNDGTSTAVGPIATPEAVLGRSNAGVVSAVLAALEEGRTVHMVGGGDELKRMAEGAKELQEKGRTRKHPELVPFRSWKQVRQYVDKHDSAKQLEVFVRLVDEHGADTLIEMVGQLTEDATDADLIVATAHKSKGLEWGLVQVGTDFRGPKASLEPGQPTVLPSDEELRLAYVTATRGMRELDLGSLAYVEELRALADEVYAARTGVAPQPATPQTSAAPTLVAQPTPASEAGAPTGAPPAPGAFQVLKAVEAQKLAAADGTLWWGGRGAGREKALKKPILVRIEIGQRGVVDVKDADTGTHVTTMRTGTPFFAAPATSGPPQNSGAPHEAQAPASSPAAAQPGGESATVSAPAAPVFKVEARPEVGGRRWAVLDAATREVVWVHKDGQALECAYDVRADAENMRDALALAPELRVDAPDQRPAAAEDRRRGEVLPATLGQVTAKVVHDHGQWVKVELRDGTQRIVTLWNPAGADLVEAGQSVYVSGTLSEPATFNGRLETPVEGGTVEGQNAADTRLRRATAARDVSAAPASSATATPAPAAEQTAQALDVPAELLARLRKLPYAQRSTRWAPIDLQPQSDRRVEILLRTGEWAQVAVSNQHNVRDSRGRFHGLEDVLAWRDGTRLATLLDQPKQPGTEAQHAVVQSAAPSTPAQPVSRPPLISRPVQSMLVEELEERANALSAWLDAHTAGRNTRLSVRAVQQRDEIRAELAQRRDKEADAAKAGDWDAFSDELADLTLKPVDLTGTHDVSRDGTPLGTVTLDADGYRFLPAGARTAASTLHDSPQGAAVALARHLAAQAQILDQTPARQARKPKKAPAVPAPRFLVTAEDGPDASPNMLLKAHLRSVRLDPKAADQLGQRKQTEFCHKHATEHAGTHLSAGGRLAILTIGAEHYEVRAPDRLTGVGGPWGSRIHSRERANEIAAALESIRDEQGRPFLWDQPPTVSRALQFRDRHGNDLVSAILHALVQRGLDETDGRYAQAYEKRTGQQVKALSLPAPAETAPSPAERDPAMPADDAFFRTIVKKIAEVSGPDGSFWWKGEVNNPHQGTGPRANRLPFKTAVRVRVEESDDEKGASIGWLKVLDADTGEHLDNVRSTSHVLVAAPRDLADEDRRRSAGQRFSSVGHVRSHFVGPATLKGIAGARRSELRRLAKDRELVELTADGQFAIRRSGETFEVIPAGSGLSFTGVLPDLHLTPRVRDGLALTPQPLQSLPTLEQAHAFAERVSGLTDSTGAPVDWSDPALAQQLTSAGIVHMGHQLLRERALLDREHGRPGSPSDAMWQLFEAQTDRAPEPDSDHQWADQLKAGDWAWLSTNDGPREILAATQTDYGTALITLEDGTWHVPRNLPVEHPGGAIVRDSAEQPIGMRLDRAWVRDDDVIEFDVDDGLSPAAPAGPVGEPSAGATRVRGRVRATHQHPHGGGERVYLLDATLVTVGGVSPAPTRVLVTAFELPETVYRLSARAALAPQPASSAPPVPRPLPSVVHRGPTEAPEVAEASEPVRDTAPDERADVEHGEALRLDLIAVLDDANAPSTPTELTSIDGMPLYVGVKTSPTNGRVLQFGFDPQAPRAAAQFTRADLEGATGDQVLGAVLSRRPGAAMPVGPGQVAPGRLREDFLQLLDNPDARNGQPVLHGTMGGALRLYTAVAKDPEHGKVVAFGFDPSAPVARFTRDELLNTSSDTVAAGVQRYGEAHVQAALQSLDILKQLRAGAQARQAGPPTVRADRHAGEAAREYMRQTATVGRTTT